MKIALPTIGAINDSLNLRVESAVDDDCLGRPRQIDSAPMG